LQTAARQLRAIIHDMETEALFQFRPGGNSHAVIDHTQDHSLSRSLQSDDNFARLRVLVRVDDRFACDTIQMRCGHIVVDAK